MPLLVKSLPFLLGRQFRQELEKLFVRQPWLEAELAYIIQASKCLGDTWTKNPMPSVRKAHCSVAGRYPP